MTQEHEFSEGGRAFEGLSFLTVKSEALRGRADMTLYVPDVARPLRNVPVVILLHGAHGSHWAWSVRAGVHRIAHKLMKAGRLAPSVLAMPSDGLWGDGSGYLTHATHDFEKWIVEDVPAAVRAAAACVSLDSPLFLCGLSMGGFGAMRIGAKYPALYRGISAHSSITHVDQMKNYLREDPARNGVPPDDYSVFETILRGFAPLPPLRFDCGLDDPLLKHNRQLHADLKARDIPHEYHEFPGAHDWAYWTAHVEDSLLFFGKILSSQK